MPPQPNAFLEQIIRFLMPFFIGTAVDVSAARSEILETLAAYATRTRAELLNAAQIIAFSMSALDTLSEAKATEMSASLRLRFRGCANGLNRSTQQRQQTLDRQLACDQPAVGTEVSNPVDDVPEQHAHAMLEQAKAKIDSYRNRLSNARPTTTAAPQGAQQQAKHNQLWANAIMDTLNQIGLPDAAAPAG